MDNLFVYHKGRKLKCGYTTGSCATAAAKGAALMLDKQEQLNQVQIDTPADRQLTLELHDRSFNKVSAECSVIKDAGDDHDVTNGIKIFARVTKRDDGEIHIKGGEGIGRITKPGFWGTPGEAAINPVPRQMITEALSEISDTGWEVEIYAPEGKEIAEKTLNSKLGIVDGISIIGTTGIVEPMSNDALKQTIYLEIDDIANAGAREILLYLGNYGENVAKEQGFDLPAVKISNFIGDAVLYCKNKAFERVVLIGHIGKISKLSLGAFNTHSSICDLRIEAFVYYLALAGAPKELMESVSQCSDSEEALLQTKEAGFENIVTNMRQGCIDRIRKYVKDPHFNVSIIIYSMTSGILD